jgi:hypothetical protein
LPGQADSAERPDGGSTMSKRGIPFIALGTAFLGMGLTGLRTFLYVGIVFLILGVVLLRRKGR